MNLKKALNERLQKAKYTKRTGSPGNYQYFYGTGAGMKAARTNKPGTKIREKKGVKTLADEQKDYLKKKGLSDKYVEKVRMRDLLKLAEMVEVGYMSIKDVESSIDDNDVLQTYEEYLEEED